MADMTDSPFCRVCREGAKSRFVIFREMVSSEALVRDNARTLKMCEFHESERPIVIQIFGADPKVIRKAARVVVEKFHPDGIDINMGCPVPKIAGKSWASGVCHSHESGNLGRSLMRPDPRRRGDDKVMNCRPVRFDNKSAGAALMKDPGRAVEIVRELKAENLGVPVTVKTRLGWSKEDEILEFAPRLQEAGADAITIHGRTKTQGYSGKANWEMIAQVKQKLKVPIIANGDIMTREDIVKCLEITGADGVMIGRGALGNPWIFRKIKNQKSSPPGWGPVWAGKIKIYEFINTVLRHAELHVEHYGERGMVTFRKHLAWYFKGDRVGKEIANIKELRNKLVRVSSLTELKGVLAFLGKESFGHQLGYQPEELQNITL
ncbi:MAG: tRNA-dihydrouridine synthase [Candidatus Magasanikbacteria bacterium GW2011_GWA2_46_17]|uniref:tRNA-dihydrouridine synthase n=1 Tax=Candidatus Magasanikbacteria bacterium GW2011_GWA2_46_17 TaxID=1619042 RepID=A0A0G1R7Y2_9BACT|nr:MAG: tRNA-dihydrouridine synthase [Candidatus Magasanikbacteria bacterium GW2011_GWA2_46_17]